MVANKRSKKQMRDDLQLFLNENTDSFVNWLHQVLDKLQEVTLPAARKSMSMSVVLTTLPVVIKTNIISVSQKVSGESKKDKKSKKTKRNPKEQSPQKAPEQQSASITDVFADQLIGKAKRSLEVDNNAVVKKQEVPSSLPSVTEMVKTAVVTSKRKELEELEQIQKQINEAKRQLKIIPGEPEAPLEKTVEQDEDDDFLNLKADEMDEDDSQEATGESNMSPVVPAKRRNRSPIVFSRSEKHHTPELPKARDSNSRNSKQSTKDVSGGKAENIISLSAHRQMERELYTPVHRRKEDTFSSTSSTHLPKALSTSRKSHPSSPERHRKPFRPESRDRRVESDNMSPRDRPPIQQHHRQRSPVRRERHSRSPIRESRKPFRREEPEKNWSYSPPGRLQLASRASRIDATRRENHQQQMPVDVEEAPQERLPVRQRIGSRVIVAPPKPVEEEEEVDVPVSSVVTIKPRPVVAKSRQANKNLLMRAMAEAQKSMVGAGLKLAEAVVAVPPTTTLRISQKADGVVGIKGRLGALNSIAGKRQRSQINAIVSSLDPVLKRQKPNEKIIIEIGPNDGLSESDMDDEIVIENCASAVEEREYVPKPTGNSQSDVILEPIQPAKDETVNNTQFVVTLDGAFKKSAADNIRSRLEPAKRRDVAALETQNEDGHRARKSSRNTAIEIVKKQGLLGEEAPQRKLIDLRKRVEQKRNGSPVVNRRQIGDKTTPEVVARKRRSPIKFSENKQANNNGYGKEEKVSESSPRKRIRISSSPKLEEKTVNDQKSKSVIVVSKEKEKRDPKKYDNIPSRKFILCALQLNV